MSDWFDTEFAAEGDTVDPRLEQFIRYHPSEDDRGAVYLVGVAHDHPSSIARVAHLVEAVEPDVLALELPPLAMPLFRLYAEDEYVPPRLGGEMSTAIQVAENAQSVGIDGPNLAYLKLVVRRVVTERVPLKDIRKIARYLRRGIEQALACRLGATVGRLTPYIPKVYAHIAYNSRAYDTPSAQAKHERNYVTERRSFLRIVELPRATVLIDAVREETMALRLKELRSRGDVVAVIGIEHLDRVSERLDNDASATG